MVSLATNSAEYFRIVAIPPKADITAPVRNARKYTIAELEASDRRANGFVNI